MPIHFGAGIKLICIMRGYHIDCTRGEEEKWKGSALVAQPGLQPNRGREKVKEKKQ